jgi:hypothetical protein
MYETKMPGNADRYLSLRARNPPAATASPWAIRIAVLYSCGGASANTIS